MFKMIDTPFFSPYPRVFPTSTETLSPQLEPEFRGKALLAFNHLWKINLLSNNDWHTKHDNLIYISINHFSLFGKPLAMLLVTESRYVPRFCLDSFLDMWPDQ